MDIEITIKNYRCFEDSTPGRFAIKSGFTSLVGVNNSGKSALLKFFYEFRGLFGDLANNRQELFLALQGAPRGLSLNGLLDQTVIFCNQNSRDIVLEFRFAEGIGRDRDLTPTQLNIRIPRGASSWTAELILSDGGRVAATNPPTNQVEKGINANGHVIDLSELESTFKALFRTFYVGPFRNMLDAEGKDYFDVRVGQKFIEFWQEAKTGHSTQNNEIIYKLTKEIQRIFEFNDLEINSVGLGETLQVFIDGKSYKLNDIGSGIAQFIFVLASAALRQPTLILIDEPELNLHPSLQLDFLTTLGSYATEGVIFATHSLGLARAGSDRIYSIRKLEHGSSEIRPFEATNNLSELLGELSFAGYKEIV